MSSVTQSCLSLCNPTDWSQLHKLEPARLLCLWDFPGKNTRAGCHFLPQGILSTQGSNLGLLHSQADSLPLHQPGVKPLHWECGVLATGPPGKPLNSEFEEVWGILEPLYLLIFSLIFCICLYFSYILYLLIFSLLMYAREYTRQKYRYR